MFVDQSYGPIDHVSIAVVSTSDDLAENLQSSKRVNQSGSFVHPMTKEKVRHFDIGIPFPPIEVLSLDAVTLTSRICSKIIEGLYASQDRKMPSDFEYRKFIDRLIPVLEKYVVTG